MCTHMSSSQSNYIQGLGKYKLDQINILLAKHILVKLKPILSNIYLLFICVQVFFLKNITSINNALWIL